MMHDEYGVFNWFIRKAMDNEEILYSVMAASCEISFMSKTL